MRHLVRPFTATAEWLASATETINALIRSVTVLEASVSAPTYTVATLPSGTAGQVIYVSDEVGGAVLAFSDGVSWRRVTDRAVVA